MNRSMRFNLGRFYGRLILTGTAFMAGAAITQAETAYEALWAVANKYGDASLERIVEVQGNSSAWTVSLLDPQSPVKLQEIRVRNGRVVSTGTRSSAGRSPTPINLDELNLDSDGALQTANRHLQKTIPPSRADYTLSTDANGSAPIWVVTLRDEPRNGERFLQIAANNGAVLNNNAPGAPVTAAVAESTGAKPAVTIAAVSDEPTVAAVEESRRELPAEPVAEEEVASGATSADPIVTTDGERNSATKEFRPQKTSSRSKSRSSRGPDIIEKVAGKVERKVRFVRRIIPF